MDLISLYDRDVCSSGNNFNGSDFGARISSIFVLLAVSALGSFFPLVAKECPWIKLPGWIFFITRYVGSGVIVATGFIHLLAESSLALTDPCLGGVFVEYPWAEGIALMGVFLMFLLDIVAHKKIEQKVQAKTLLEAEAIENDGVITRESFNVHRSIVQDPVDENETKDVKGDLKVNESPAEGTSSGSTPAPAAAPKSEEFYIQILNSFVLEFGIVFHSVFVGLSLAIAGDEFKSLYVAIAFHQMFEGLGLGTRFAMTQWPEGKKYTPWLLSLAYSLTTPIAIAIGIGVRYSYPPGSRISLIVTGTFDGVCAGVLIYNSLVELMAYDFMYSSEFKGDKGTRRMLAAYFFLSVGAFAMALIGKWA